MIMIMIIVVVVAASFYTEHEETKQLALFCQVFGMMQLGFDSPAIP